MRDASRNESFVAHSTNSRAGRSVRLHTIARSLVTSPLWTPYGTAGRIVSEVMTAGALVCAHTGRRRSDVVATPPTARADCPRNLRRFMVVLLGLSANVSRPSRRRPPPVRVGSLRPRRSQAERVDDDAEDLGASGRSEEHTSELQSLRHLVC